MELNEITEKIIGCAFEVSNTLGNGFLEKVYENSLVRELKLNSMCVKQQCEIKVSYKDEVVGKYFADILVEDKVIVELKAVKKINDTFYS